MAAVGVVMVEVVAPVVMEAVVEDVAKGRHCIMSVCLDIDTVQ